ncbi:CLUMA_CG002577, isoform A [Clunio marinus]|uniref:CLUMA_CG002577, isoform A n=1 Tax=Clunio marinus TaxID=568069 RepID=A0A1J1HM15_9DIPT|nr:CLUMA_CG002577, isoform A [Clunio marinus]
MEKFLWIPTLILILSLKYVHGNFRLEARLKHNLTLTERLEIEKSTYHWYPYQRIAYHALPDGELQEFCLEDRPSAIEEFPDGIWTREYLKRLTEFSI